MQVVNDHQDSLMIHLVEHQKIIGTQQKIIGMQQKIIAAQQKIIAMHKFVDIISQEP